MYSIVEYAGKEMEERVEMMDETVIALPHLLDIDTGHDPAYRFRRRGSGDWILAMCFRTAAVIRTANGLETAAPGDCILHSREFDQLHHSVPGSREGFRNDWLYSRYDAAIPLAEKFGLPFDALLPTGRPKLLEHGISAISRELEAPDEFTPEAVREHLAGLFRAIRRAHRSERRLRFDLSAAEQEYYPRFRRLREELRGDFTGAPSIPRLAARLRLSPERFAALYRKFFGAAPYADHLEARLLKARRLLLTTTLPVKTVARECGWQDPYYFSRLFTRHSGDSPVNFRKAHFES